MNARDCVVGLVVEGPSDERTVRDLVGRMLDVSPSFQGIAHGELFITWRAAATMRVPRRHGDFGKGPAKTEDAPATSNALQAFVGRETRPVAVVLLRDSDGKQDERMLAIKGECEARPWPFKILVGVPHTKRECWILAALGVSKMHKAEADALKKQHQALGFDPTKTSEKLTDPKDGNPKNPKTVLNALIGSNNKDREEELFHQIDLERLREHGARNGLADFMAEIEAKLCQL